MSNPDANSVVFPFRRFVSAFGLALAMSLAGGAACKADAPVAAAPTEVQVSLPVSQSAQNVQVADEIIRELRRLGLNVIPDRIDRPYDPKGELC